MPSFFRSVLPGLPVLLLLLLPTPTNAQADATGTSSPRANRPNVLWLIAEDMGPELGAYGQANVRTPHLDSLAARGMLFTHAFTTSPVCSPSRSALNTGLYRFTIGAHLYVEVAYSFQLEYREAGRGKTGTASSGSLQNIAIGNRPLSAIVLRTNERVPWNL